MPTEPILDLIGLESIMIELNSDGKLPDFGVEPVLSLENLEFHSGNRAFTKEDFIDTVAPYFVSLKRANRTNFLCAFVYGNGDKADVTGYKSDTTINVTNNSKILKSKETNGSWVVFKLNS